MRLRGPTPKHDSKYDLTTSHWWLAITDAGCCCCLVLQTLRKSLVAGCCCLLLAAAAAAGTAETATVSDAACQSHTPRNPTPWPSTNATTATLAANTTTAAELQRQG